MQLSLDLSGLELRPMFSIELRKAPLWNRNQAGAAIVPGMSCGHRRSASRPASVKP
ncbi:hypothetical protein EV128_107262 [Rhizobium azibense]|nr:hypothetical protein EV128_107262 [Rhizobium azibense]